MERNNNNNLPTRLPRVTLEIFEPGDVDQELRTSAWFITINTNKAAPTVDQFETLKQGLRRVAEELQDPNNMKRYVIWTNRINVKGPVRYVNGPRNYELDSIDTLESVDFRVRIEKSPSTAPLNPNRVHMHIYLKIVHRSNIHLNQSEIRDIANEVLVNNIYGVTGVYVNIRTANTGMDNILKYLGKPQL